MTNYLPPNPSLKQLKTQAKDLLSAHRAGLVSAVEARDVKTLRGTLERAPDLAHAVSPQGTLLEMAARVKGEDKTAVDIAQLLIDAGAFCSTAWSRAASGWRRAGSIWWSSKPASPPRRSWAGPSNCGLTAPPFWSKTSRTITART